MISVWFSFILLSAAFFLQTKPSRNTRHNILPRENLLPIFILQDATWKALFAAEAQRIHWRCVQTKEAQLNNLAKSVTTLSGAES